MRLAFKQAAKRMAGTRCGSAETAAYCGDIGGVQRRSWAAARGAGAKARKGGGKLKIYNCNFSICCCLASWRLGDGSSFIREISRLGMGMVPLFGCGGPVRAFFRFTMVSQAVKVANMDGFAKIRENPRFSLDNLRLYANLLRVTTWHAGLGGDGTKAGLSRTTPRGIQVNPSD
ncbi:MAG: hypothetical protein ABSC18_07325 [Verrucomicrobiota bacterium]